DSRPDSRRRSTSLRRRREAHVLGSGGAGPDRDLCGPRNQLQPGETRMKIDIFNHIFPKTFFDKYIDKGSAGKDIGKRVSNIPTIVDIDARLRALDEFGDYVQVISLPLPPIETIAGPEKAPQIATEGNDGLAELVRRHDRFLGFVAALPMNNPDAALGEMRRAIDDL